MTTRRIENMCPHCGWRFDILLAHDNAGLVPKHAYPETPVGGRLCPGSDQNPRNPESDRRPLWKDVTTGTEEKARFAGHRTIEEACADEAPCEPVLGGLCKTHPTCEHVRDMMTAGQAALEQIRRMPPEQNLRVVDPMMPRLEETALSRIDALCDQWERNCPPLPPDARHILRRLVRRIVLDAADLCDSRAKPEDKSMSTRNEARKCADTIRHFLLCGKDEAVCLRCDGAGCAKCNYEGIRKQGQP